MVKVKKEVTRSDLSQKKVVKSERSKAYSRYLRSKQFQEVKTLVYERQKGICPICGEMIDNEHPGSAHHRSYRYAGMGGEIEAQDVVYIHRWEHQSMHRAKQSYGLYSVLNDRNEPAPENQSELAQAIRREREINKKRV